MLKSRASKILVSHIKCNYGNQSVNSHSLVTVLFYCLFKDGYLISSLDLEMGVHILLSEVSVYRRFKM